jgi:hypothetical protein
VGGGPRPDRAPAPGRRDGDLRPIRLQRRRLLVVQTQPAGPPGLVQVVRCRIAGAGRGHILGFDAGGGRAAGRVREL